MKDFINGVITLLQKEVGDEFSVKACDAKKNNGVILHGITICNANEHTTIAPAIYLDEYYQEYSAGKRSLKDIAAAILALNKELMAETPFDVDTFSDFTKVRDGIMYKLINFEKNQELLQEIPYVKYLDMAIVFFYEVPDFPEKGSVGNILIRNNFMEIWDVDVADLYDAANDNTPVKHPVRAQDLESVIKKITEMTYDEENSEDSNEDFLCNIAPNPEVSTLYILSNRKGHYGAACLLYPDLLNKVTEKLETDNIYILPSSVHEVLVLPVSDLATPEQLRSMVKSVNMTEVSVEDYLSDNVYIYRRYTGLEII